MLKSWIRLPHFIKREPVAVIGLVLTLILGLLGSPIFFYWYAGPELTASITYNRADDGRCVPSRVNLRNTGRSAAANVRVHFQTDYFGTRGDVIGYYSGDEPLFHIQKQVEYTVKSNRIVVPEFPPGLTQEFRYIEEHKDSDASKLRANLIAERNPAVFDYPKINLITSDQGEARVEHDRKACKVGREPTG